MLAALPSHAQEATQPAAARTTPPDTLRWSNGDSLHGRLLSAKDNVLLWKSPLFVDPVQIDGRYLTLVEFGLPPIPIRQNAIPCVSFSATGTFCLQSWKQLMLQC